MIGSILCGKHEEDIPANAPPPLGKERVLTHHFDASLIYDDVLSGNTMTCACMFCNKTPVDWYCKQQSTTKTTTYGAKFLSGRKCCENIIDHRLYL